MLINFFFALKKARIPVSITELLHLLEILKERLVYADIDEFYYFSRMALVKDERHYDKFDRAFSIYFKGLDDLSSLINSLIPDDYLRREFEKTLTSEELENILRETIQEHGFNSIKDLGKLLGFLKDKYPGQLDMQIVAEKAKKNLQ